VPRHRGLGRPLNPTASTDRGGDRPVRRQSARSQSVVMPTTADPSWSLSLYPVNVRAQCEVWCRKAGESGMEAV